MNDNKNRINQKYLKIGAFSMVMSLIVIAVVIAVNLFISELPTTLTKYDMSELDLFSISEETEQILAGADTDVTFYILTQRGGEIIPHGTLLPLPLMEICGEIDETNRLAALAATGDRSALRECVEVDPALAGLDRLYVQDVVDRMIGLHSDVLSRFDEEEE